MRSAVMAMLWENWQLTKVEAAQRLGQGIIGGAAAILLFGGGATLAFWILVSVNAFFWFSIAKLNGGRSLDGYRPGFPLYLLYTRPVRTSVLVGVAMAYDALSAAASYVVSALVLGLVFKQSFPLVSVAVWIMAFHLTCLCVQWSSRTRVIQWLGMIGVGCVFFLLLVNRGPSLQQIGFAPVSFVVMIAIAGVAVALTIVGVARQRRGDSREGLFRGLDSDGYPDWLIAPFRFPCPTSSMLKAQTWFELKSSGFPVLMIGLGLALLIFVTFAISIAVPVFSFVAIFCGAVSVPAVLILGSNAFGIRRRQGRTYLSAFDATQPFHTSRLAVLKIVVRTCCVLLALAMVGASAWASIALVRASGGWLAEGSKHAIEGFPQAGARLAGAFASADPRAYVALAIVVALVVWLVVAGLAAFRALWARYPRQLFVAGVLALLWGLVLAALGWTMQRGIASAEWLLPILGATQWIASVAMLLAAMYFAWRLHAERLFTPTLAGGLVVVTVGFAAAWALAAQAVAAPFTNMPAPVIAWSMSPALLPLVTGLLAPWALARLRHI